MTLLELAKRVRRGVKLLDRLIPNWRRTMRNHQDQYDFQDGDHCILGTLEHYNGRMSVLKKRRAVDTDYSYGRGAKALGLKEGITYEHGFDGQISGGSYDADMAQLDQLWRAEFEK